MKEVQLIRLFFLWAPPFGPGCSGLRLFWPKKPKRAKPCTSLALALQFLYVISNHLISVSLIPPAFHNTPHKEEKKITDGDIMKPGKLQSKTGSSSLFLLNFSLVTFLCSLKPKTHPQPNRSSKSVIIKHLILLVIFSIRIHVLVKNKIPRKDV